MTDLERGPSSEQSLSMRVEQSSEPPLPKQEEPVAWQAMRQLMGRPDWTSWYDISVAEAQHFQKRIGNGDCTVKVRPLYTRPSLDARMREALEAFADIANTKGGTSDAEGLKDLLVVMMNHVGNGNGMRIIGKFADACLNARAVLAALSSPVQSGKMGGEG